jgi:hypothetical protein
MACGSHARSLPHGNRAWIDAGDMARWYAPADGMTLSIDALDVRVGAPSARPQQFPRLVLLC